MQKLSNQQHEVWGNNYLNQKFVNVRNGFFVFSKINKYLLKVIWAIVISFFFIYILKVLVCDILSWKKETDCIVFCCFFAHTKAWQFKTQQQTLINNTQKSSVFRRNHILASHPVYLDYSIDVFSSLLLLLLVLLFIYIWFLLQCLLLLEANKRHE